MSLALTCRRAHPAGLRQIGPGPKKGSHVSATSHDLSSEPGLRALESGRCLERPGITIDGRALVVGADEALPADQGQMDLIDLCAGASSSTAARIPEGVASQAPSTIEDDAPNDHESDDAHVHALAGLVCLVEAG